MSWSGRCVAVTGAGGFIGSHLAERLAREGARVRALVHYNSAGGRGWLDDSELQDEMEVVAGDIRDFDSVRGALAGAEVVFHLAALIAIPYSYRAPASYVRTNIDGTVNVLQAARDLGIARVVHTSTSEVYGTARHIPIGEDHPLQGQSPYSATKIGADKIAEAFHLSFELPVVTVRPFNTFGPRQSARAVIPTIITQCLSGSTISLGSLTPTRDMNYIDNTVDGFLDAGGVAGVEGRVFNLGSGREASIAELVELIAGIVGTEVSVARDATRVRPAASEVERLLADHGAATEALGWTPRVSLEDGLRETVGWIENNLDRYRPGDYAI